MSTSPSPNSSQEGRSPEPLGTSHEAAQAQPQNSWPTPPAPHAGSHHGREAHEPYPAAPDAEPPPPQPEHIEAVVAQATVPTDEKKRLHPLTPLLTSVRMLVAIFAAASWQMIIQNNIDVGLYIALATGVIGGISGWLSWMFTGYQFVGRELHITEGVLVRRHRSIPLERLQSVEVAQPLFARPFKLAALRLDVAGAAETEAPLAYMKLHEANHLRSELLRLSHALQGRPPAQETPAATSDAQGLSTPIVQSFHHPARQPSERLLAAVPDGRLIGAHVLDMATGFILLAIGLIVIGSLAPVAYTLLGFTGALFILAIGVISVVSSVLKDWRFTCAEAGDRLWVRRGITERRSQVVPLERVTLVVKESPLWWRMLGWSRVRAATASVGLQGASNLQTSGTVLPVGPDEQATYMASESLRKTNFAQLVLHPVPRRARFRLPATWWVHAAGLNPHVFACQYGLLTRRVLAVPYARIQSVGVVQGPWQRALNLATVKVKIPGGLGLHTAAISRDVAEAMQLAAEIRQRADAAAADERAQREAEAKEWAERDEARWDVSPAMPPAPPAPPQ
ncbi:PH domain-containing protein [Natronoglycomyces albus]|uniref:PH domain-containing protein n=1 Tax=Natronoglycomyces albus TaxID=2811108 RepID=A0A895XMQ2_9ACTN|nr:PH domain-containing protein [Natronoglycomyces albus]QSB06634.1 PH domain-containing protein [Natronoglycomyces albus]